MKLHFIGLPHTETIREYEWCAYTTKLRHMGEICKKLEIETILYNGAQDEGEFGEIVEIITERDRNKWFGHIDWNREVFGAFNPEDDWWVQSNLQAIVEIEKRIEPNDFICIIAGRCQELITQSFPKHVVLEWAVGYEGVLNNTHRCFESEAWRHFIYGKTGIDNGRFFDCVIPNSFDPKDYIYNAKKENYLLYLGRMTPRKGMSIIEELASRFTVVTAGQGDYRVPGAEHMGVVRGKEKAELLSNAKGLLCPTQYIEPFGGVAIEAMMSGTPVISTDFGAFTETVYEDASGIRCRTLKDFLFAVNQLEDFDHQRVRQWGLHFSLDAVAPKWNRWFNQVSSLYQDGWYQL